MDQRRDYYEILGVPRDADERTLKKAYRTIAMREHPDRNPGDAAAEARFKEASEAYAVLSDADQRARYDRFGHAGLQGGGAPDMEDVFSHFGDIFADLFGGGRRRADPTAPRRGDDLQTTLRVPFRVAVHGGTETLRVPRQRTCGTCDGSGAREGSGRTACGTCGGVGQVRRSQGLFVIQTTCPACGGAGSVIEDPCPDCGGRGTRSETAEVDVSIPRGVDTGVRLRLRGEGGAGRNGGPHGDLFVILEVETSDVFQRDGADLHLRLPIDFTVALLGGQLDIPTVDGDHHPLEISPGAQPGQVIRLDNLGLPHLNRDRRGRLHVHLDVEIPRKLSRKERDLVEQLAEIRAAGVRRHKSIFDRIRTLFEPESAAGDESSTASEDSSGS
ncbi:MAG: molecular chaperone DnaJ [Deltaproteobacteria bacterium]|nr:MAG: molecular chaperone DnaJ [Deltaproteobacteria bacterium]